MAGFKVPLSQRQVGLRPLPTVQQQVSPGASAFGTLEAEVIGQLGRQVEQLGETALAVEAKEKTLAAKAEEKRLREQAEFKDRKDKLYANDAIIKYQDWWRTQEPAYTTKTGLDADGVGDVANADIEKKRQELHKTLNNDEQIRFFDAKFHNERDSGLNVVAGHETNQMIAVNDQQTDAIINNSIRDASAAVGKIYEEGTIFSKKFDLEDAISDKTKGLPKEAAKKVSDEIWSYFHESILNRKVAIDATVAQEYYNKHKKEILPDKRDGIEAVLKIEDTLSFAQQKADEIILLEDDRTQWDDIARKTEYPGNKQEQAEKRKATLAELKTQKDTQDQEDIENTQKVLVNTLKSIDASADKRAGDRIANSQIDPIISAKGRSYSKAKFDIKKEDIVTNRPIQAQIFEDIDSGKIDSVDDLLEFVPDLSPTHYDWAIRAIRNKKNPDAKVGAVSYGKAKKAYQLINDKQFDVDSETQSRELMFGLEYLDQHARDKGDDLTQVEANKLMRQAFIDGDVEIETSFSILGYDISFGDPAMTFEEARAKGVLDKWTPDVNADDIDKGLERKQIIDALRKQGIITEDETVLRLYKKEAILGYELSPKQKELLNRKINKIGIIRPIQRQ